MVKDLLFGIIKMFASLVIGLFIILIIIGLAREVLTPKDLSKIEGVWLTHDGDEQMYGKLELRVVGDSAYFGSGRFAGGRSDSSYSTAYKMRLTKDSLLLITNHGDVANSWRLEYLNEEHLVLKGDSYSYDFTKQATVK